MKSLQHRKKRLNRASSYHFPYFLSNINSNQDNLKKKKTNKDKQYTHHKTVLFKIKLKKDDKMQII